MSTTTMHAYTVPESLVPGHVHPNTQRKYREVLRKFQVTQETTWPDVLAAVNAVGNTPGRSRGFAQNLTVPSMPSVPSLMELRLLHQEGDLLRVQVNSRVGSHLL